MLWDRDGDGGWEQGRQERKESFPANLLSRSVSPLLGKCAGRRWSLPPAPLDGHECQSIFPPSPSFLGSSLWWDGSCLALIISSLLPCSAFPRH